MTGIIYSPKDIFEQEFKTSMRGFDKKEVDEFLDNVIKDYEYFNAQIEALKAENEALKKAKAQVRDPLAGSSQAVSQPTRVAQSATNFDMLKRISKLEKEVFGKQIIE
ncbi:TPA: cell division regulator GpsB [Streptococcus equi subsp. zooepidemicus]|uniref:Cell cycle protein GpsB n=9 Tax=Streptococcus equi TaxID=1336 RepID=C0M790_STRE4|nr:cell division regulator GpsB [Streptococcus equi]KIS11880.1 DivIVA protein [Streptococcus equi subsp. zooepidemicus Sz105]KIS16630.1 DivIVA protein [Streptococcus equi subsp. zooepidemicus Sz4is]ACG62901.1 cell division initiation protein DivIVA [Streptococcus equi subsp. zooepidemicus MGCS10565]AEJ25905.1 cell division initiation protein DivIVA [Streptococcus equi subsp. zooepidemicus ATCC 35246]AIA67164.1 cell division protein GpsB [Streptococcus equi subsp. zooepidemicus CY]